MVATADQPTFRPSPDGLQAQLGRGHVVKIGAREIRTDLASRCVHWNTGYLGRTGRDCATSARRRDEELAIATRQPSTASASFGPAAARDATNFSGRGLAWPAGVPSTRRWRPPDSMAGGPRPRVSGTASGWGSLSWNPAQPGAEMARVRPACPRSHPRRCRRRPHLDVARSVA